MGARSGIAGAGASDALAAPHSAPRLARALGAYLRATGTWGERVVGNSMGGYLAMRLALDEPAAMSRLVTSLGAGEGSASN